MGHLLAKIDSIVRISSGVLLNTPSVDSIEDIKISSKHIKRGDLYIDVNNSQDDIIEAINSGAYCILSQHIEQITDDEIAWIKVEDLEKSLIKLARFFINNKDFRFIPLLDVQYALAKHLHIGQKAKLLSNSTSEALVQILTSQNETLFFVVKNSFIQDVDPTIEKRSDKIEPQKLFETSLFYCSFIFKNRYIKDIRLSSFFIPYLCSLMEKLDALKIDYKVENFNNFEHFYPQFITSKLEKSDFGTTRQVVIFENNLELYHEEKKYLHKKIDQKFIADSIDELQEKNLRYALVYGNKDDFLQGKRNIQLELFNDIT